MVDLKTPKTLETFVLKSLKMAPTHTKPDNVAKTSDPEITEDRATQTVRKAYSREELIEISRKPLSKKRPEYLKAIYNNSQGVWDPDLWSQDRKKENGDEGIRPKRERVDSESQQQPIKKKYADPKDRLRDEQDGIILSPQRRSFGTGCHVTQVPSSRARPESPIDRGSDRDAHRDQSRRIGSGRIVNRERDFGNFRVGAKFDRDERDRDQRYMGRDRRDMGDRRNSGRYHRVEEEPEWFSEGPTSQHDTIELRGFDDVPEDRHKRPARVTAKKTADKRPASVAAAGDSEANRPRTVPSSVPEEEEQQERIVERPLSRQQEVFEKIKDVEEQGIQEKAQVVKTGQSEFDFEDFFRMETIPGLFAVHEQSAEPPVDAKSGLSGSRFGQFFQRRDNSPVRDGAHDSRRSSTQEELAGSFMNEAKESVSSKAVGRDNYFAPISPVQAERPMSLLEMLQGPCKETAGCNAVKKNLDELERSGKAQNVQEIEAGLKNLVMGGRTSNANVNPKEEEMAAFKKLVAQISDGHVTAASQGICYPPMDKGPGPQMNLLKNAPTEQDLLEGLVKGQPVSRAQYGSMGHRHGSRGTADRVIHDDNPLAKLVGQQPRGGPIQRLAVPSQGNALQQHQREILSAILKQQQQQQQQLRRHPSSPMQPAIIQCPPSPPPPTVVLQGPVVGTTATSPRSHSPHPADGLKHQQTLVHQQQQTRVPSPLVFGQTPPVISHAPSPVHPTQVPVGAAINPNSLFVQSAPLMPRVLSPQELMLHTQHIMQNALIKRKLEEQKENFRKRQELQGATSSTPAKFAGSGENSTPSKASGMSPTMASFTPTSVMRKMQAEKDRDGPKPDANSQLPMKILARAGDGKPTVGANGCPRTEDDRNRPLVRTYHGQQSFMNGHLGPVQVPAPVGMLPVVNQGTLQGRPIVKGNQGLQRPLHPSQVVGGPNKNYASGNTNGFDVAKLFEQQRLLQHANQRQMSMSPMPPSVMAHSNMNARPLTANPQLPNVGSQQGNAMLRNAMHNVPVTAQQNQRLMDPYHQQQQQQHQQQQQAANNRMFLQTILMGMGGGASGGRGAPINVGTPYPVPVVGSPLSPNQKMGAGGSEMTANNFAKWFGADVLRQRMPNMPPVPTQKAMSVEEVEQQQQQQSAAVHI